MRLPPAACATRHSVQSPVNPSPSHERVSPPPSRPSDRPDRARRAAPGPRRVHRRRGPVSRVRLFRRRRPAAQALLRRPRGRSQTPPSKTCPGPSALSAYPAAAPAASTANHRVVLHVYQGRANRLDAAAFFRRNLTTLAGRSTASTPATSTPPCRPTPKATKTLRITIHRRPRARSRSTWPSMPAPCTTPRPPNAPARSRRADPHPPAPHPSRALRRDAPHARLPRVPHPQIA